jgi:hypothetical protein
MHRRCLKVISSLTTVEGIELCVIAVDKEAEPNNQASVEEFAGVVYVHESRSGISRARNAAIEAALETEARWRMEPPAPPR